MTVVCFIYSGVDYKIGVVLFHNCIRLIVRFLKNYESSHLGFFPFSELLDHWQKKYKIFENGDGAISSQLSSFKPSVL